MYIFIEYLVSKGVYRKVLSGLQDTQLFPLTNSEANTKPWAGCVPGCVVGEAHEVGVLCLPQLQTSASCSLGVRVSAVPMQGSWPHKNPVLKVALWDRLWGC